LLGFGAAHLLLGVNDAKSENEVEENSDGLMAQCRTV